MTFFPLLSPAFCPIRAGSRGGLSLLRLASKKELMLGVEIANVLALSTCSQMNALSVDESQFVPAALLFFDTQLRFQRFLLRSLLGEIRASFLRFVVGENELTLHFLALDSTLLLLELGELGKLLLFFRRFRHRRCEGFALSAGFSVDALLGVAFGNTELNDGAIVVNGAGFGRAKRGLGGH